MIPARISDLFRAYGPGGNPPRDRSIPRLTLGEWMVGVVIVALYLERHRFFVIVAGVHLAFPFYLCQAFFSGKLARVGRESARRCLVIAIGMLVLFNWLIFLSLVVSGAGSRLMQPPLTSVLVAIACAPGVLWGVLVFIDVVEWLRRRRLRAALRAMPPPREEIRWL